MAEFDLLIRGGMLVTEDAVQRSDIGIQDGVIAAIGPALGDASDSTIEAEGLHIFPGLIDSHVHLNEPGRTDWEGIETGSRALAAGGATLFFDMPLNSDPPTVDAEQFDRKAAAARACSVIDFAIWGGLVPQHLDHLEELDGRGVVGFKAFMADSGIAEFPRADDRTLLAGMKIAARLKRIVAVHAEREEIIRARTDAALHAGKTSAASYLESRPIEAELEAIRRALDMAGETGCALHIVHVSCGRGIELIDAARKQGVDVSCETCPHYLTFTDKDFLRIGALAKCAPPLRPAAEQEKLWQSLEVGRIDTVGSDHSPAPMMMKSGDNFFKIWGGISGAQHTLPLLLSKGNDEKHLSLFARLTSFNVAKRFQLPVDKGVLRPGAEADLALVDLRSASEIRPEDLFYRHRHSPYTGRKVAGKVMVTLAHGRMVYRQGRLVGKPGGRLVKPTQH